MLNKKSYMKREDIERLIADRVISPEAGAKILDRFGRRAVEEMNGLFWLLPVLGMILVIFGASTLLATQWIHLAQAERIGWLAIAGVIGVASVLVAWKKRARGNAFAEVAAAIAILASFFDLLYGSGLSEVTEPTLTQMHILCAGLLLPLLFQWLFSSVSSAILYYVYLIWLMDYDATMVWPFYEALVLGFLPLGMCYYWWKHRDGVRLMFFTWAFSIAGAVYIVAFFWNVYVGLILCLATGCFLASFWKIPGIPQALNAWRVLGIPSVLLGVGVGEAWLQLNPELVDVRASLAWFALGIVLVAGVLWKMPAERVVKRVGWAMTASLVVLWILLWLRSWQFEAITPVMVDLIWVSWAGMQGAWLVTNGVRYRSLFFLNLGVLFIMVFTFLLPFVGSYMETSTMGWILVLEGVAFLIGNIFFSKHVRSESDEDDGEEVVPWSPKSLWQRKQK